MSVVFVFSPSAIAFVPSLPILLSRKVATMMPVKSCYHDIKWEVNLSEWCICLQRLSYGFSSSILNFIVYEKSIKYFLIVIHMHQFKVKLSEFCICLKFIRNCFCSFTPNFIVKEGNNCNNSKLLLLLLLYLNVKWEVNLSEWCICF